MAKQLIDILVESGKLSQVDLQKAQLHAKQNIYQLFCHINDPST